MTMISLRMKTSPCPGYGIGALARGRKLRYQEKLMREHENDVMENINGDGID